MTEIKSFLSDKFAKAVAHIKEETEKVRARDEGGSFVSDDPSTPENEAWVEKPVKAKAKPKAKK